MLRHLITSINYAKLIEQQANGVVTKFENKQNRNLVSTKPKTGKIKTYNMNNGVTRHH